MQENKPKSHIGAIVAIIVSSVIIAAGAVVVALIIANSNKNNNGDSGNGGNSSNNSGNNNGGNSGNNGGNNGGNSGGNSGNNGGNSGGNNGGNNGGGSNSSNNLIGTWKITGGSSQGIEVTSDVLERLGYSGSFTFRSDGTGTAKMNDDSYEFTYDAKAMQLTDPDSDQTVDLTFKNNKLVFSPMEGVEIYLEKQ